jgi:RimJ/RimL family protein N-acetyltransferase
VTQVRQATPDDAPELVRLRGIMLSSMSGDEPPPGPWQDHAELFLRTRLAQPDGFLAAFVVDRPAGPGKLAACAVGSIEHRLAGPDNPRGTAGYVFNVATDPDQRRRGYSRACMGALMAWFAQRDVRKVDLRASPEGEPLYASLGFARTTDPAMRWRAH